MANWFYYTASGEKVGPITPAALKALAMQGVVTPETVIENGNGRSTVAAKVNGLTFPETATAIAPNPFSLAPSPPVSDNPFVNSPSPFKPSPTGQSLFTQPVSATATAMRAFCTYCGQSVQSTASVCMACGTNPWKHRKFCASCGIPINEVQVICTKCHTPVGGKSISIGNTGIRFESELKKRQTYVLLAVLILGAYGIHNFYAGRKSQAIAQLIIGLLGAVFTAGIVTVGVWIWAIVEAITVKEDGEGRPMV